MFNIKHININKSKLALFILGLGFLITGAITITNLVDAAPFTVTSITPNQGPTAGGQTITITGTNFQQNMEWKQISASNTNVCAITSNDRAYCWGGNGNGQIGDGTSGTNRLLPTAISQGDMPDLIVKQISSRSNRTCAIGSDDRVYCWGLNTNGEVGNNTSGADRLVPTAVSQGARPDLTAKQVTVGNNHTCVIASNDQVYCWGQNPDGRIGDNTTGVTRLVPVAVSQGVRPDLIVKHVYASPYHTCVIASNDRAYCWGPNTNGEIGDNTSGSDRLVPTAVSQGARPNLTVKQISAGSSQTCAIASNDQAYCWGGNGSGQIGDNTSGTNRLVPTAVSQGARPNLIVKQISVGTSQTCAIASNDQVYCWGSNGRGQIGDGTTGTNRLVPTAVLQGARPNLIVKQIVLRQELSCAIAGDNQIYCWGRNDSGQFGINSNTGPSTCGAVACSTLPVVANVSALPKLTVAVIFSSEPCTNVIVTSNTQLTCTTPAHPAGLVDVSVTIGSDISTLANGYEYIPPLSIVSITPDSGSIKGGELVTITGTSFDQKYNVSNFSYTGNYQEYVVPADGLYKLETWGAQGGAVSTATGGRGGYNSGSIYLTKDEKLYIYVGQSTGTTTNTTSFNGGGTSGNGPNSTAGGGATDIRLTSGTWNDATSLRSRIMVSAGGGATGDPGVAGGAAGGLTGITSLGANGGTGGTQTAGGTPLGTSVGTAGAFGIGGNGNNNTNGCGAGGGYYGGGGGNCGSAGGAGGGSSFISGHTGSIALASSANNNPRTGTGGTTCVNATTDNLCSIHYSSKSFTNTTMIDGNGYNWTNIRGSQVQMPNPAGGNFALGQGNNGNGYARITPVDVKIPVNVSLGEIACTNVTVISSTQLTCITPAHTKGFVDVAVTISGETETLVDGYEYLPSFTIDSISPDSGPTEGGQEVTITGTNFEQYIEWKQVIARNDFTCAIASNDQVYCWGSNDNGRLGDNTTTDRLVPTAVSQGAMPSLAIKQISAGNFHTCAIASNDQVYCWGSNEHDQIGDNTSGAYRLVPTAVLQGARPNLAVRWVEAGNRNTCVIASNDQAYCWGWNHAGQIGDGTIGANRLVPTAVDQGARPNLIVKQITVNNQTCAIASNDQAYCWGDNTYGQIGDNTSGAYRLVPTAVLQGARPNLAVKQISNRNSRMCAIADNDQAYCWGWNNAGQIGDGTIGANRLVPVAVVQGAMPSLIIKQIRLGNNHTCVIASDNRAYCWGSNSNGQFGNNTTDDSYVPTPVDTSNLDPVVTVDFDDEPCTNVTVISNTELTCTTPTHEPGLVDVSVTIGSETETLYDAYEYIDPYINMALDSDAINIGGEEGLAPSVAGAFEYTDNTVSIETNLANGFNLLISTHSHISNSLDHLSLSESIDSTSGSWLAQSPLQVNSWGFTLTPSPTDSANIWSAVPKSTSPLIIKSTNVPAEPADITTIYYGAKIDLNKVAGQYKAVIVYTAIANP